MNDDNIAGAIFGAIFGAILCVLLAGALGQCPWEQRAVGVKHACGECDHVGECGDYECRPGVDGWKLKAGAR